MNSVVFILFSYFFFHSFFHDCFALPSKPNFVILFADDLGYGDLSSFGHPTIYTPNLDRLLSEGRKLTQWYSGWPVCTPSRAALLTARNPLRSGLGSVLASDAIGGIPSNETLLPEILQENGYTTGMIGKWHLGQQQQFLPTKHGFDYYYGVPYSADMGSQLGYLPLLENSTIIQQPISLETLELGYAEKAVDFIQQNKERPFFLYMAHNHAHVALQGQWCSAQFNNTSPRGMYGNAVQEMDWVIGQIMNTIRALDLSSNTLVIFTSDNGPWLIETINGGSAGLFYEGKGSTWEGGIRMPAIAWWPGVIPPSSLSRELFSTMDIFPTILNIAGISPVKDIVLDGMDVTSALLGTGSSPHQYLYFWNGKPDQYFLCAIRTGDYKIHFVTFTLYNFTPVFHSPPLLYNVNVDPSEHYPLNVSSSVFYSNLIQELTIIASEQIKTMTYYEDQVALGVNTTLALCCNLQTNCTCSSPSYHPPSPHFSSSFSSSFSTEHLFNL